LTLFVGIICCLVALFVLLEDFVRFIPGFWGLLNQCPGFTQTRNIQPVVSAAIMPTSSPAVNQLLWQTRFLHMPVLQCFITTVKILRFLGFTIGFAEA